MYECINVYDSLPLSIYQYIIRSIDIYSLMAISISISITVLCYLWVYYIYNYIYISILNTFLFYLRHSLQTVPHQLVTGQRHSISGLRVYKHVGTHPECQLTSRQFKKNAYSHCQGHLQGLVGARLTMR